MFRFVFGVVAGYFFYTENGKKMLNNTGDYMIKSLKSGINDINKKLKGDDNAGNNRHIQTNDERSITSENVRTESPRLQENSDTKINGVFINSSKEN